jgi:NitT/TauT family transport system permease protein
MKRQLLIAVIPAAIFLSMWELLSDHSSQIAFFFSSPSSVATILVQHTLDGTLLGDLWYTAIPTIIGFSISVLLGTVVGLLLAFESPHSVAVRGYVSVFASIPIFAIAPMMIIWFGIGLNMKLVLAVFASIFVAISQAYNGALTVAHRQRQIFESFGATRLQIIRHLFLPLSIEWILSGMKTTSGLALLGTFLGEFMASEQGLAHRMLVAGSLYNVGLVLACAVWMVVLIIALNCFAALMDRWRIKIAEFLTVSQTIWSRR